MTDMVNLDRVIMDITNALSPVVSNPGELKDIKLILEVYLSKFQIYEEETALSTDMDYSMEYIKMFLQSLQLSGCTKGSIYAYGRELTKLVDYLNKSVRDITIHDLRRYLAEGKLLKGWSDRTYNNKLVIIRGLFKWLYEEDFIENNPAKKLKETKVERRIGPTLQPEQREEVRCACVDEREIALCDMLYSTGARISELCALNISDINFVNMSAIVYGKGRKEREIYFNAPAKIHLQRYLKSRTDDNPALFVTLVKPFRRLSTASVRSILKKIKSRDEDIADIKLTPHVFRRTVGTEMINRGAPLELVAEKLGHVKLDTTKQCYAALSRETVHQAHNKYVG